MHRSDGEQIFDLYTNARRFVRRFVSLCTCTCKEVTKYSFDWLLPWPKVMAIQIFIVNNDGSWLRHDARALNLRFVFAKGVQIEDLYTYTFGHRICMKICNGCMGLWCLLPKTIIYVLRTNHRFVKKCKKEVIKL